MNTYKISYLPCAPGIVRDRIISADSIEEAQIEFNQQRPFTRVLNIKIIKPLKTQP